RLGHQLLLRMAAGRRIHAEVPRPRRHRRRVPGGAGRTPVDVRAGVRRLLSRRPPRHRTGSRGDRIARTMTKPLRIAITGAAGNIGYALAFRLAAGNLAGPDRPVVLQLLEIPPALSALEGVAMELRDCAFPLDRKSTRLNSSH